MELDELEELAALLEELLPVAAQPASDTASTEAPIRARDLCNMQTPSSLGETDRTRPVDAPRAWVHPTRRIIARRNRFQPAPYDHALAMQARTHRCRISNEKSGTGHAHANMHPPIPHSGVLTGSKLGRECPQRPSYGQKEGHPVTQRVSLDTPERNLHHRPTARPVQLGNTFHQTRKHRASRRVSCPPALMTPVMPWLARTGWHWQAGTRRPLLRRCPCSAAAGPAVSDPAARRSGGSRADSCCARQGWRTDGRVQHTPYRSDAGAG